MANDGAPAASTGDASPSNFRSAISAQSAAPAAPPPAAVQPPVRPPVAPAPVQPPTATQQPNPATADPNNGQPWPVPGDASAADPITQQLAAEGQVSADELAAQMQQAAGQPAAQTGALEQLYHGVSGADILAAIAKGTLPPQLLEHIGDEYELDGLDGAKQKVRGTFKEWKEGGMRHSRFTRGVMELAAQRKAMNERLDRANALFADWDKPEGFAKGVEQHGLVDNVHAYVTRNWGTEQQPNVQGFMESIQRLNAWPMFELAASHHMEQYSTLFETFGGGQGDPADPAVLQRDQRAHAMTKQYLADQRAAQAARFKAEAAERAANARANKIERDALLRTQQPQQPTQVDAQRITGLQRSSLEALGINAYNPQGADYLPIAGQYLLDNMRSYYSMWKSGLEQFRDDAHLIAVAADATRDELRIRNLLPGGAQPRAAAAQLQRTAQPAQLQHLPARPTAAPTAVTVPGLGEIPTEGDPAAFRTRLDKFKQLR